MWDGFTKKYVKKTKKKLVPRVTSLTLALEEETLPRPISECPAQGSRERPTVPKSNYHRPSRPI
jgi:hypothetical protein